MDTILIIDGNKKITLFFKDNKLCYLNHSNSPIDIKRYLDLIKVKNLFDFIIDEDNTLFKGTFFKSDSIKKIFNFGGVIMIASIISMLQASSYNYDLHDAIVSPVSYVKQEFDTDYFRDKIIFSPTLSLEEKKYLYNRDFLDDIIPFVNSSNYLKYRFDTNFTNIDIIPFNVDYEFFDKYSGYYSNDYPSAIYIKNYDGINEKNKDTIAHEFIHLCQAPNGYNFIKEACAEIISYEYFDAAKVDAYTDQVKLLKILMEIIGPEPIWYYNFTGDFSLIEDMIRPYLNEQEYNCFLDCMTFSYNDSTSNLAKFKKFEELLSILYQNIFQKSMDDDIIISLLRNRDKGLNRSYFNKRHCESYYLDYENAAYHTIDLDTAINEQIVYICAIKSTPISFEEAKDCLNSKSNYGIRRKIDYGSASSSTISIHQSCITFNKQYISAFIDGEFYEDVDVDDLVERGIIKVDYYLVESKYLTALEYINHDYDEEAEIFITHDKDVVINEDYTVYTKIAPKIYIPTIFEKENNNTSIKKHVILNSERG